KENRDAFYKIQEITVRGTQSETVELRRPFAQLNIGTNDYEASKKAGYEPKYSSVTVKGLGSTLNLWDGTVDAARNEITFGFNDIPTGETFPVDDYEYLAMNYLLVPAEQEVVDIEFSYGETATAEKTRTVGSVPVQRNHRTNIYGQLLTSDVDINVEIKPAYDEPAYEVSEFAKSKGDIKTMIEKALAAGETNIVINALNENIGDLNYAFTKQLVPTGVTVTLMNAIVEGKSYGNGVNGDVIFENCVFTHTGAYSIHFDNGAGNVTFKNCVLYGWNSFGSTLNGVNFYDSKLYGNGKYAIIRSYVDLYVENCYFNTKDADHTDVYNEGVEVVNGATKTEKNCTYSEYVDNVVENILVGGTVDIAEDMTVSANSNIHTQTITSDVTINGNGKTIVSVAESVDDFQWEGGTIPAMSTIFSSDNGSTVTVNDLTFSGTMSALMLGHYQNATYNNYNTVLNNVNVINTEVVSFSAGIAPAVCIYGTATLNNCNIYGTTLSELDTDPMWPVYDVAAVNYSTTTLNNSKIGSFYFWNQAALIVNSGSVIEELILLGNMKNSNNNNYININAGAEVKVIDLSKVTDKNRVKINIEAGATVGKIVANGVEYASLEEYKNA
ncbi:MAG: hypothetical protein IKM35_04450, partial [Bacteroidaceae bacterium]|nr:hypothetical protein [Bacteroidaceae bacterium]